MTHFPPSQRRSLTKVRRHLRMVAFASALMLTGSCDGVPRTVTGLWIGRDGDREVRLFLTEADGEVTGWGLIRDPAGSIRVDYGTHDRADVAVEVGIEYADGLSFGAISGELSGGRIIGVLSGLAFKTDRIVLSRSPLPSAPAN